MVLNSLPNLLRSILPYKEKLTFSSPLIKRVKKSRVFYPPNMHKHVCMWLRHADR